MNYPESPKFAPKCRTLSNLPIMSKNKQILKGYKIDAMKLIMNRIENFY